MIEEQQGTYVDGIRVFVAIEGGRLRAMIRATDQATFDAQALAVGLKVYANPAIPSVVDPETNEVITPAVDASGPLIPAGGTTITELGPFVLTPAVLDDDGNEIAPAIVDSRYHVNFWLSPEVVEDGKWKEWAVAWSMYGHPAEPNKTEVAVEFQGIELIDPLTVASPSNTLL